MLDEPKKSRSNKPNAEVYGRHGTKFMGTQQIQRSLQHPYILTYTLSVCTAFLKKKNIGGGAKNEFAWWGKHAWHAWTCCACKLGWEFSSNCMNFLGVYMRWKRCMVGFWGISWAGFSLIKKKRKRKKRATWGIDVVQAHEPKAVGVRSSAEGEGSMGLFGPYVERKKKEKKKKNDGEALVHPYGQAVQTMKEDDTVKTNTRGWAVWREGKGEV